MSNYKEYLGQVRARQLDSRTMKPSGNVHESCVDPSVCLAKEVSKLLRLVEIMIGALEKSILFSGNVDAVHGCKLIQRDCKYALTECERILSE